MSDIIKYAELIRASLNIGDVARFYGLEFNRAKFALCPFHSEKTPSFTVQNRRFAHCFGCGWNGEVIKFVMDLFGISFRAACERLNDDFRLGLPLDRKPTLREQREAEARWRELERKRERREQARQLYDIMYHRLMDEYIRLDKQRTEHFPTVPDKDFDPLYVEAVKKIDYIEYLIDVLL